MIEINISLKMDYTNFLIGHYDCQYITTYLIIGFLIVFGRFFLSHMLIFFHINDFIHSNFFHPINLNLFSLIF